MRLICGGESHGKALVGIIEGLPAHLKLDVDEINYYLALRQSGYGRGARQKIESDKIEILSGVRCGETLGSPLAFSIVNRDYENWRGVFSPEECDVSQRTLTRVRPGHADLTGMIKYDQTDARNILERASARETAIRVAAGAIARQYLRAVSDDKPIEVTGYVKGVCGVIDPHIYPIERVFKAKSQPLFMLDNSLQDKAMKLVDELKAAGDTAGGIVELYVANLKSGFGNCMQPTDKLDANLCAALMGVQAIKGVEVGLGFEVGRLRGSQVHDEIFYSEERGFYRETNNAGGIEGGMSNGETIVLRAAMKPIPTLMRGLKTVDFITKQPTTAAGERSDVAAICAAEVICESVICSALAEVVAKRLGGDTIAEARERYARLK